MSWLFLLSLPKHTPMLLMLPSLLVWLVSGFIYLVYSHFYSHWKKLSELGFILIWLINLHQMTVTVTFLVSTLGLSKPSKHSEFEFSSSLKLQFWSKNRITHMRPWQTKSRPEQNWMQDDVICLLLRQLLWRKHYLIPYKGQCMNLAPRKVPRVGGPLYLSRNLGLLFTEVPSMMPLRYVTAGNLLGLHQPAFVGQSFLLNTLFHALRKGSLQSDTMR